MAIIPARAETPDPVVVTLDGELDLLTSGHTADLLSAAVLVAPDIVVDLRAVTFVDSTGLAPLVRTARQVRRHGGSVSLVIGDARLERVIRLARLASEFTLVRTPPAGPNPVH